jgi:hypothetical protein
MIDITSKGNMQHELPVVAVVTVFRDAVVSDVVADAIEVVGAGAVVEVLDSVELVDFVSVV